MSNKELFAGEAYNVARARVSNGAEHEIKMIARHLVTMIRGNLEYEGPLWRVRLVPPDSRRIELDNFLDYLLLQPRDGLGFKSVTQIDLLLKTAGDIGEEAIASIKEEVPNWDDLVRRQDALDMSRDALAAHGDIGNGRSRVDNINSTQGGTSESYALRRLKRDDQELFQQVLDGQISAHAAAVKAGFRKPYWSAPCEVSALSAAIKKKFGADFAAALRAALD